MLLSAPRSPVLPLAHALPQALSPLRPRLAGWRLLLACCTLLASSQAGADTHRPQPHASAAPPAATTQAERLPAAVEAALQRAQVPRDALSVVVLETQPNAPARLLHHAQTPVNPASLMKLVTTTAALDLLGPAFVWRTPVAIDGTLRDGVLNGNVYIQGSGDPRLTVERLWLMLRRLQGYGVQRIQGDIVLDRSAFNAPARDAASFDGEPLRPYNAAPDALLLNFKSLLVYFVPDASNGVARVHIEPPLAPLQFPASVPLAQGDCNDYRSGLRADWSDPARIRFAGSYPLACGEKVWPVAYSMPALFAARAIAGMWQQLGGQLSGQVREGLAPAQAQRVFVHESPPLTEVVRDINKFSNNVMAQQVFLTLSQQQGGVGSFEASRALVLDWWKTRLGADAPQLDNGAGLSRDERISALALARVLQQAWNAPYMPELVSSLPVTGQDGTLKRSKAQAVAHLKTGSLRDVAGIAGFVDGPAGQRWVLVAVLNHPNAAAARPALDALIDWTAQQP